MNAIFYTIGLEMFITYFLAKLGNFSIWYLVIRSPNLRLKCLNHPLIIEAAKMLHEKCLGKYNLPSLRGV